MFTKGERMREAHLRDFIAVIESGSVRSAATRLGISQSAVSKNLTAMERQYGLPLLVRSAHGVAPTEAGLLLLRRARVVERELARAAEEIKALTGRNSALVTVGISTTAEALLLAPSLLAFRRRHPDAMVTVEGGPPTTTLYALREGRIDFAIGPELARSSVTADLRFERLLSSDRAVICRRNHPLSRATELKQLQDAEWMLSDRLGDEESVSRIFREAGLQVPRFAVRRYSFSASLYLLLQTDWLATSAVANAQAFMDAGMLARVPVRTEFPPLVIGLYTAQSRPLTEPARHLAEEFRRAARRFRSAG